jgi:hypothetical protein
MKKLFLLLPFFTFLISSHNLNATCKVADGDTIFAMHKDQSFELKGRSMLQNMARMRLFRVMKEESEEDITTRISVYGMLGIALFLTAFLSAALTLPPFIFIILFSASMIFSWMGFCKSIKVLKNKTKRSFTKKTKQVAIIFLSICILSIIIQLISTGFIILVAASFG